MYIIQCILFSVYYSVYIIQCILFSVYYSIQVLFSQYVSKLSANVLVLRRGCGLEEGEQGTGEGQERGEEWTHLQSAFGLIQCCGMQHTVLGNHLF